LLNQKLDETTSIELNETTDKLINKFLNNSDMFDINYLDFNNPDEIKTNINKFKEYNDLIYPLFKDKVECDKSLAYFEKGPINSEYSSWFDICQEILPLYDRIESKKIHINFRNSN
jgi:hypothetical protein